MPASPTAIAGPAGPAGADGADGADGAAGANGADGADAFSNVINVVDDHGADNTGVADCTTAVRAAMAAAYSGSLATPGTAFTDIYGGASQRRLTKPIYFPGGRYLFTSGDIFSNSMENRTWGPTIIGDGAAATNILFQPTSAAALFDMTEGFLHTYMKGMSFGCDTTDGVFWQNINASSGYSRQCTFENCQWVGEWGKVFHFDALNHNSEFEWLNCQTNIRGRTEAFIHAEGSDQEHGFHIRGGTWEIKQPIFKLEKGGKISMTDTNIITKDPVALDGTIDTGSPSYPNDEFYLFDLLNSNHSTGQNVCIIQNVRVEHRGAAGVQGEVPKCRLLRSEWGKGAIHINGYFGTSQASGGSYTGPFEVMTFDHSPSDTGVNKKGPMVKVTNSSIPGYVKINTKSATAFTEDSRYVFDNAEFHQRKWDNFVEFSESDQANRPIVEIRDSCRALGTDVVAVPEDQLAIPNRYTSSELSDITSKANVALKYEGRRIWDTTKKKEVFATGNQDTDDWHDGIGNTAYQPSVWAKHVWNMRETANYLEASGSISRLYDTIGASESTEDPIQGTTSLQPLLITSGAPNGQFIARFDGTDDTMKATTADANRLTAPYTIWAVCKRNSGSGYILDGVGGTNSGRAILGEQNGNWAMFSGAWLESATAVDTSWHILMAIYDGANSELWLDDTQIATGDSGTAGVSNDFRPIVLGSNSAQTSTYGAYDIAEIIVADTRFSAADNTYRHDLLDDYFLT